MSAAEVIEMIRNLPPKELDQVVAFVLSAEEKKRQIRYADDEEVEAITKGIFERHDELFRRLAKDGG